MKKEDCFYLGIVARKHSYKGEVVIVLDTDEPELYANIDAVFIEMNNTLLPFFIDSILLQKSNQLRVDFEEISNEQEAEQILKKPVYLPLTLLPKLEGNKFYYHEVIGFTVVDKNHGEVGVIKSVNDTTAQVLFVINSEDGREILIPVIDQFLEKIDRENKQVCVNTPDGLFDLFLDEE